MNTNSKSSDISEVYWLLDRVLEDLGMAKQLLYDKYQYHERLLLSAALAFSGLINDDTEINDLIKKLEDFRWRTWATTISFYLGLLARNYIRKRRGSLPSKAEVSKMFEDINKKFKEFHKEGNIKKAINVLFIKALFLDLTKMLDLDVSNIGTSNFTHKILSEYLTKALELPLEYRIKLSYTALVFHDLLNEAISCDDLKRLLSAPLSSLSNINVEYRTFMLRVLTALQMIEGRQEVLKSLVNEYKSRFMYTTEKALLKKLIAKLISGNRDKDLNIRCTENKEAISLEIILTEEQIESIARPNIIQYSLIALGLMISGYHHSYTVPLCEQHNYFSYINLVKEVWKGKVQDRLLLLDKLKLDRALITFLNKKVWPTLRNEMIYKSILLLGIIVVLDFVLLPIIGGYIHIILGAAATVFILFVGILKTIADVIHTKYLEILKCLSSRRLRQILIQKLKEQIYEELKQSKEA